MNTKQVAVFFVALLSLDYASATFFRHYRGVPKNYDDGEGYYGWSSGCRCNEDLTSSLDEVLEGCQTKLGRYSKGIAIRNHNLEEYELSDGRIQGIHKFERKSSYRCSLSRDNVKIYFFVRFFKVIIRYYVSIVEDIFNGFLGGIFSFIGRILGRCSNLPCHIILPDVYATCILSKNFDDSEGFVLEGWYWNKIENVSFLHKIFLKHLNFFVSIFRPVCDHTLHHVFQSKLEHIFSSHFRRVTVERSMFTYESSSSETETYRSYSNDEENDD